MVFMRIRDRESIQEAVRRFRKIVERSGLKREMRRRQYYEKPSTIKRRAQPPSRTSCLQRSQCTKSAVVCRHPFPLPAWIHHASRLVRPAKRAFGSTPRMKVVVRLTRVKP